MQVESRGKPICFSFQVSDYDVQVKEAFLEEALNILAERKRDVVLVSYFMEMSYADIVRKLHPVRSTVHELHQIYRKI